MNIFKQFVKSIYDINWLRERRNNKKEAIGYFFFLSFVISLIFGTWLSISMLNGWQTAKTSFRNDFPYFKAEMKSGQLFVSELEQPFFKETDSVKLIVDTATSSNKNISDFIAAKEEKLVVLITAKDFSYFNPSQSKIETTLFKDAPNFLTNKDEIVNKADGAKWIIALVVFLIFVFCYIIFSIANIIFLLFWSLIVWVTARTTKKDWKYSDVLAVGVFALTTSALVDILLNLAGFKLPFLSVLVFLAFMLSIIFAAKNAPAQIQKVEEIKKPEEKKEEVKK
jgi:hypothetical protein